MSSGGGGGGATTSGDADAFSDDARDAGGAYDARGHMINKEDMSSSRIYWSIARRVITSVWFTA